MSPDESLALSRRIAAYRTQAPWSRAIGSLPASNNLSPYQTKLSRDPYAAERYRAFTVSVSHISHVSLGRLPESQMSRVFGLDVKLRVSALAGNCQSSG